MMKHQTTLVTGLAALALVPTLGMGQEEVKALENALAGTVRALEIFAGLEEQLKVDADATLPLILSATEAPQMEDATADDRLGSLRRQVSLLQMELDAIENPMAGDPKTVAGVLDDEGANPLATAPLVVHDPNRAPAIPRVSQGLPESVRSLMRRTVKSEAEEYATQQAPAVTTDLHTPTIEPGAYSADPMRQAKASYHAGRFADGLVLLEGRTDTQSLYWRARCLMRLERHAEAIDLLTSIVESAGDTYEGRRAATDLEFARWKRDFEEKLPEGLKRDADK